MAKDPAFLFYSSDFLTGVTGMTMEERGQYITLLCLQHQQGKLSEKTCRLALGLKSLDEIPDVMGKFKQDKNGLYYNARLDLEVVKRAKGSDARRENGQKGGRPKKPNSEPEQNPQVNLQVPNRLTQTEPKNNLSENENDNRNINEDYNNLQENVKTTSRTRAEILADRFNEFWEEYPRKVGNGKARDSWNKIKPSAALHQKILTAIAAAKESRQWQKDNGEYIPNPATWLNQGRWDDEPEQKPQTMEKKFGGPNQEELKRMERLLNKIKEE